MKKFIQNIFNTGDFRNICIGNGNVINGGVAVNSVVGDNIVMVNGKVISGNITAVNGVSMKQGERSFRCTGIDRRPEVFSLPKTNNCSEIIITVDESIDRMEAEIKAVCYAPDKEQADEALEKFSVIAVGNGQISSFEERNTCSEEMFVSIKTEYNVKVPKLVKEIIIKQTTSDIMVRGFEGMLSLKTTTGKITVTECSLANSSIKTATGSIDFINNSVINHTVDIKTSTGEINLLVNGGARGNIFVEKSTGSIRFLNRNFETFDLVKENVVGESVFAEVNGCTINASVSCCNITR